MAENIIFAEKELTFSLDSTFGVYANWERPASFSLTEGVEYDVVWDTDTYTRTAFSFAAADGSACIAVGNPVAAGQAANEDTFAIVYDATHNYMWFLSLETKDTHKVGVYQIVEDEPETPEEPEGIVLKDRNGNDVAYYGIETVTFDTTTEGKQQVYTKGVAVDALEIVPDFSGGDMPITAPAGSLIKSAIIKTPAEAKTLELAMDGGDMIVEPSAAGKLMSEVVIKKPDTLIPENIAEGVNIAGLVGTFAGGSVKIASGTFTVASENTITHALGVVPDIVVIFPAASFTASANNTAAVMFGVSTAFKEAYSYFPAIAYACRLTSSNLEYRSYGRCIDKPYDFGYANIIRDANESTFIVNRGNASNSPTLPASVSMRWIAIGGLT